MRLHDYQQEARQHLLKRLFTQQHSGSGLWLDCGLGKTTVTLHVIQDLIDLHEVAKTLIIAPKRVIQTVWRQESEEWGLPLSFSTVHGTPKQRLKALDCTSDVYLTSYGMLKWLSGLNYSFDLVVFDEITKVKNWTAQCTKAAKRIIRNVPRRIGLTATPTPNTILEVFPQTFLLDGGETLGRTITYFRERFAVRGGFKDRDWIARPEAFDEIMAAVAPIYLHQSAVDHLDMPDLVKKTVKVELPSDARKTYSDIETEFFAELDSGQEVFASTAGSKYSKLRQICSGAVYCEDESVMDVHSAKVDALKDTIEDLNGRPVIVAYHYKHSLGRLLKALGKDTPVINGSTTQTQLEKILKDWVNGNISILLCQPQSAGHGLDKLQKGGGDLIWFDLTDQPEVEDQMIGRIYRQGSKSRQVHIQYLVCTSTVEVAMMRRLRGKGEDQKSLLQAVKEYRKSK